jgi:hypothetical protein
MRHLRRVPLNIAEAIKERRSFVPALAGTLLFKNVAAPPLPAVGRGAKEKGFQNGREKELESQNFYDRVKNLSNDKRVRDVG